MSEILDVAWKRAGAAFRGALYEPTGKMRTTAPYRKLGETGLAWACEHAHVLREDARECALAELARRQEGITDGS